MKNNVWLKVFCVIAVVLFCSSCVTNKTTRQAPEDIPDEELAVVKTGESGVTIVGIDLQTIQKSSTVFLEPGVHSLSVKYDSMSASSVGSSSLKFYFAKGVEYKIAAIINYAFHEIKYQISINAPTNSYYFKPVSKKDKPVFSQEAIEGVRIYEGGVPPVPFTPIANIKLQYGKPLFLDDPEYEDEINLFKQYAYDLGANAVFFFENDPKKGTYPTDNFSGCAVKIDEEFLEEELEE